MKKRIFLYMSALSLLSVLILCGLVFFLFALRTPQKIEDELRNTRITLIAQDGSVLYDSDSDTTENHADRPEIQDAQSFGHGMASRYSDTLEETTHYYAVRLPNSDTVRIAMPESVADDWLTFVLPAFIMGAIVAIAMSLIAARLVTRRILKPLDSVDLDRPETIEYDELAPFMSRIAAQKASVEDSTQQLTERDSMLSALTANMQEGLLILDDSCNILSANACAGKIFHSETLQGENLISVTRDLEFIGAAKQAVAGQRGQIVFDVGVYKYEVLLSPSHFGAQNGAILLFVDITDKVTSQRQRQEFTANVSHELKTPLTTISGLAELMHSGNVKKEDIKSFSGKICEQSQRLSKLIEDIIRLSELDEAALQADFENIDLYAFAKQAVARYKDTVKENVQIEVTGDFAAINGNDVMIDELLENLLTNAVKYGKEGGHIKVDVQGAEKEVVLTVTDNGIGIAPEHHFRIFERFYRVDKSRSKKTGGTGLGLAIVKHVMELHSGTVEVQSKVGEFTSFICRFPVV